MSDQLAPNYRLDPLDRGVIGKLTRRQLTVLGVAAVAWLLLSVGGQGMVKPAALFAVAALVAVPPVAGQPIIDWMPLWAGWGLRGRWHRRWSRPLHLTTAGSPVTQPALPPWLGGLRLEAHPTDGWAAIHDQASKTLTAHLHMAGTGFSTLAPEQMERLLEGWGSVFAAFEGLRRIAWTDIARPMPLVGHAEWVDGQRVAVDRHRRVPGVRRRADPDPPRPHRGRDAGRRLDARRGRRSAMPSHACTRPSRS